MDTLAKRPLLLGHRGARRLPGFGPDAIPSENTITAFDYCLGHGCDGFEFDVRHTRDGRHVLCHDPKHNGKEVAEAHYDVLVGRDGQSLPCLEDVLQRFGDSAFLDIELKVSGNEEAVVLAIHSRPPRRGFLVSTFLPAVIHRLHEIHAPLPLGYICEHSDDAKLWTELPIRTFIPHYSLVTEGLVREVHACGMHLLTWTVNRRDDLLRLANWGVDGLISDDPRLLSQTFAVTTAGAD